MIALPPDVIRWISRNGEENDCTIAAIALATGESYEQVLGTAMQVQPEVLTKGLYITQQVQVLNLLGFEVKKRKEFDREKDTGIVIVEERKRSKERHAVYLWAGRVIEPSVGRRAMWLDLDAYCAHEKSKVVMLLEISK